MKFYRSFDPLNGFTSSTLHAEGTKRITGLSHVFLTAWCGGERRRFFRTSSRFRQARHDAHLPTICKNSMAGLRATGKAWQYHAWSKRLNQLLSWVKEGVEISSSDSDRIHSVGDEQNSVARCPTFSFPSTSSKDSFFSDACGFASTSFEWKALIETTPFAKSPVIVQGLFFLGAQAGIAALHEEKMRTESLSSPEMGRLSFSFNSSLSSDTSIRKEKVNAEKGELFLSADFILSQWVQSLLQDLLPLLYFFTLFPHHHYSFSNSPGAMESLFVHDFSENDPSTVKKNGTSSYSVLYASQCLLLQWILYTWTYTLFHTPSRAQNISATSISSPLGCILTHVVAASEVIVRHLQKHRIFLENRFPVSKSSENEKCEVELTLAQVKETHETLFSFCSGLPIFTDFSSQYHLSSSDKSEKTKEIGELASCIESYLFQPEKCLLAHHSSLLHVTQPFSLIEAVNEEDETRKNCFGPVEVDHSWVEHVNALLTSTAISCS